MTSAVTSPAATRAIDVANARPRFNWLRLVAALVILVVVGQIVVFVVTNPRLEWPVVGRYLLDPTVFAGLGITIALSLIAIAVAAVLGTLLALGQMTRWTEVRLLCQGYVGLFRSIPPLVQLIFWFNLGYLLPQIGLGVPFGPLLLSFSATELISPFTAAIIGLGLHEAAYAAETIRAGILSVDQGQRDAAAACGFTRFQTFGRVVLPQAMRVIIPPAGNQFINLLKGTSLVSVIGMSDLLFSVQAIYNRTYQVVPLLIVAVLWYLVVVTVLTIGQRRLERAFGRGYERLRVTRRVSRLPERSVR